MKRVPRVAALLAALALPVGAVLALLLLADPEPPKVPGPVRVGESAAVVAPSVPPSSPPSSATPGTQVGPPPVVDDDDDDDGDDDDD